MPSATMMQPEPTPQTLAEYIALRTGCGVVELGDWSSVTLTGADCQSFLNNFCTNDIRRLAVGESREAFYCDVKGKIVGHGLITCRSNELVIVGPPGQGAALASHLERYVIREDVNVRDTTSERTYLLLAGGAPARSTALALAPSIDIANAWQEPLANGNAQVLHMPVHWIHWESFGPTFAGLIELLPPDATKIKTALLERGSEFAFNIMRIEAGTPLFGVDFDESNLPQEIGRNEQAISFTKGCYLGQETVARIDALGHVNQQLVGVAIDCRDTPPVGTELNVGSEKVGRVTSATFSPALGAQLGLAMVRRGHNTVGTQLDSAVGRWEVTALPVSLRPGTT
jgi:folate-binding protein YgfZ